MKEVYWAQSQQLCLVSDFNSDLNNKTSVMRSIINQSMSCCDDRQTQSTQNDFCAGSHYKSRLQDTHTDSQGELSPDAVVAGHKTLLIRPRSSSQNGSEQSMEED